MTFPYQKLRSGIPKITAVKCLQDAPGRGFPESFTRPAAVSWLQHEEKPSITPMHRKEKTDDSSCPPSILRKRPPVDQAVGEKRKAERRVRFREPEEVIEHDKTHCSEMLDLVYEAIVMFSDCSGPDKRPRSANWRTAIKSSRSTPAICQGTHEHPP
ncbi:nutritionally-regulated adipose and cardiac enriched protein homolog isoform X3 [Struthio camelus]|uniref:nutritionally-regulated adipose and cardiac enriched protein homolog isoform X3 n=1 Tax=Struthio camelus TaxID=8801 RepID=UPI003603FA59